MHVNFLALALACSTAPEPVPGALEATGEVVATVNGQVVSRGMVDATLRRLPDQIREELERSGDVNHVVDQVILREALYQEALAQNIHAQPEVQEAIAMSARNALADSLIRSVSRDRMSDKRVNDWYQDHLVQFARPQVKARHIMVREEDKAQEILEDLKAGKDFGALAETHSIDPGSAKEGGTLGWFSQRDVDPAFGQQVFAANTGELVGPIASRHGYHIVFVENKREQIPLEEVRDEVEQQVSEEINEQFMDEILGTATINRMGGDDHEGHDHP